MCNLSVGRDAPLIHAIASLAGGDLLDIHSDPFHNRSVLTLAGPHVEDSIRAVAEAAIVKLDMRTHEGAHPRFGIVDVVPFVPLQGATDHKSASAESNLQDALEARSRFGTWLAAQLGVPVFYYGPERSLPFVRKNAFLTLEPDTGPDRPHPTAGATAAGARLPLVAYNLWLADDDLTTAQSVAHQVRGPALRTLGLQIGDQVQVSCNLIDPDSFGPGKAYDAVASLAAISRAELVGLIPESVLENEPRHRWPELGLDRSATIEARVEGSR